MKTILATIEQEMLQVNQGAKSMMVDGFVFDMECSIAISKLIDSTIDEYSKRKLHVFTEGFPKATHYTKLEFPTVGKLNINVNRELVGYIIKLRE